MEEDVPSVLIREKVPVRFRVAVHGTRAVVRKSFRLAGLGNGLAYVVGRTVSPSKYYYYTNTQFSVCFEN